MLKRQQSQTVATKGVCIGCGAELLGGHCHECGREAWAGVPTLGEFISSGAAESLEFGRRLLPTLRALSFSPGRLSAAFVEGRGGEHTHPVRLFVLSGALAFLATRLSRGLLFLISLFPVSQGVGEEWAVWATLLLAVPTTAVLLRVLFRNSGFLYLAHLVFAIHLFSFLLLLSALESVVGALAGEFTTTNWIPGVAALSIGLMYVLLAMRSFYGDPWWRLITKGLAVLLAYFGVLGWLGNAVLG
jgi:Protein of unknown function (DUF3667)